MAVKKSTLVITPDAILSQKGLSVENCVVIAHVIRITASIQE
ncbi:hypothetical protein ACFLU1_01495 [Chloroflexota bacterium]